MAYRRVALSISSFALVFVASYILYSGTAFAQATITSADSQCPSNGLYTCNYPDHEDKQSCYRNKPCQESVPDCSTPVSGVCVAANKCQAISICVNKNIAGGGTTPQLGGSSQGSGASGAGSSGSAPSTINYEPGDSGPPPSADTGGSSAPPSGAGASAASDADILSQLERDTGLPGLAPTEPVNPVTNPTGGNPLLQDVSTLQPTGQMGSEVGTQGQVTTPSAPAGQGGIGSDANANPNTGESTFSNTTGNNAPSTIVSTQVSTSQSLLSGALNSVTSVTSSVVSTVGGAITSVTTAISDAFSTPSSVPSVDNTTGVPIGNDTGSAQATNPNLLGEYGNNNSQMSANNSGALDAEAAANQYSDLKSAAGGGSTVSIGGSTYTAINPSALTPGNFDFSGSDALTSNDNNPGVTAAANSPLTTQTPEQQALQQFTSNPNNVALANQGLAIQSEVDKISSLNANLATLSQQGSGFLDSNGVPYNQANQNYLANQISTLQGDISNRGALSYYLSNDMPNASGNAEIMNTQTTDPTQIADKQLMEGNMINAVNSLGSTAGSYTPVTDFGEAVDTSSSGGTLSNTGQYESNAQAFANDFNGNGTLNSTQQAAVDALTGKQTGIAAAASTVSSWLETPLNTIGQYADPVGQSILATPASVFNAGVLAVDGPTTVDQLTTAATQTTGDNFADRVSAIGQTVLNASAIYGVAAPAIGGVMSDGFAIVGQDIAPTMANDARAAFADLAGVDNSSVAESGFNAANNEPGFAGRIGDGFAIPEGTVNIEGETGVSGSLTYSGSGADAFTDATHGFESGFPEETTAQPTEAPISPSTSVEPVGTGVANTGGEVADTGNTPASIQNAVNQETPTLPEVAAPTAPTNSTLTIAQQTQQGIDLVTTSQGVAPSITQAQADAISTLGDAFAAKTAALPDGASASYANAIASRNSDLVSSAFDGLGSVGLSQRLDGAIVNADNQVVATLNSVDVPGTSPYTTVAPIEAPTVTSIAAEGENAGAVGETGAQTTPTEVTSPTNNPSNSFTPTTVTSPTQLEQLVAEREPFTIAPLQMELAPETSAVVPAETVPPGLSQAQYQAIDTYNATLAAASAPVPEGLTAAQAKSLASINNGYVARALGALGAAGLTISNNNTIQNASTGEVVAAKGPINVPGTAPYTIITQVNQNATAGGSNTSSVTNNVTNVTDVTNNTTNTVSNTVSVTNVINAAPAPTSPTIGISISNVLKSTGIAAAISLSPVTGLVSDVLNTINPTLGQSVASVLNPSAQADTNLFRGPMDGPTAVQMLAQLQATQTTFGFNQPGDTYLILGLFAQETAGLNTGSLSPKSAHNIGQNTWTSINDLFQPSTPANIRDPLVQKYGSATNLLNQIVSGDWRASVDATVAYAASLRQHYGCQTNNCIIAGYNGGPTRGNAYAAGNPVPAETADYVPKVNQWMNDLANGRVPAKQATSPGWAAIVDSLKNGGLVVPAPTPTPTPTPSVAAQITAADVTGVGDSICVGMAGTTMKSVCVSGANMTRIANQITGDPAKNIPGLPYNSKILVIAGTNDYGETDAQINSEVKAIIDAAAARNIQILAWGGPSKDSSGLIKDANGNLLDPELATVDNAIKNALPSSIQFYDLRSPNLDQYRSGYHFTSAGYQAIGQGMLALANAGVTTAPAITTIPQAVKATISIGSAGRMPGIIVIDAKTIVSATVNPTAGAPAGSSGAQTPAAQATQIQQQITSLQNDLNALVQSKTRAENSLKAAQVAYANSVLGSGLPAAVSNANKALAEVKNTLIPTISDIAQKTSNTSLQQQAVSLNAQTPTSAYSLDDPTTRALIANLNSGVSAAQDAITAAVASLQNQLQQANTAAQKAAEAAKTPTPPATIMTSVDYQTGMAYSADTSKVPNYADAFKYEIAAERLAEAGLVSPKSTFVTRGVTWVLSRLVLADFASTLSPVAASAPAVNPAPRVDPRITASALPFRQNITKSTGTYAQKLADTTLKGLPAESTAEAVPTAQPRLVGPIPEGSNPTIVAAAQEASKYLPPGYRVEITSASRTTSDVGSHSFHLKNDGQGHSLAIDFAIIDPNGNALLNIQSPENFQTYREFAQNIKAAQDKLFSTVVDEGGQVLSSLSVGRWGGYFVLGDPNDVMHYDLGPSNSTDAGNWSTGLKPQLASYGIDQVGKGMGNVVSYQLTPQATPQYGATLTYTWSPTQPAPGAPQVAAAPTQVKIIALDPTTTESPASAATPSVTPPPSVTATPAQTPTTVAAPANTTPVAVAHTQAAVTTSNTTNEASLSWWGWFLSLLGIRNSTSGTVAAGSPASGSIPKGSVNLEGALNGEGVYEVTGFETSSGGLVPPGGGGTVPPNGGSNSIVPSGGSLGGSSIRRFGSSGFGVGLLSLLFLNALSQPSQSTQAIPTVDSGASPNVTPTPVSASGQTTAPVSAPTTQSTPRHTQTPASAYPHQLSDITINGKTYEGIDIPASCLGSDGTVTCPILVDENGRPYVNASDRTLAVNPSNPPASQPDPTNKNNTIFTNPNAGAPTAPGKPAAPGAPGPGTVTQPAPASTLQNIESLGANFLAGLARGISNAMRQQAAQQAIQQATQAQQVPSASIFADPSLVATGATSTLVWSSTYTNSCNVLEQSGIAIDTTGRIKGSTSTEPLMTGSTIFIIQCQGTNGSTAQAQTIVTAQ